MNRTGTPVPRSWPITAPVAVAVAVFAATTGLALSAGASTPPACFGAAARDPDRPCSSSHLGLLVVPTPDAALVQTSEPCTPLQGTIPEACGFGIAPARARQTVALVGDSHAEAWRAAVAFVAARRRWSGVSLVRYHCPFTLARVPGTYCRGWGRRILRWLRTHPYVHVVVVAGNAGRGVVPRPGRGRKATKLAGFTRALRALPRSVRHVFVLRDVPRSRHSTADCIRRALARNHNAGQRCSRPRTESAVRTDAAVLAARQDGDERTSAIDLTPAMCSATRCFPVVGGALVIKDIGHLTRTFSATLGPQLLRAIKARLEPGEGEP